MAQSTVAGVRGGVTLPMELHLDPVIPVRMNDSARRANHDSGLLAMHSWTRPHFHNSPVWRTGANGVNAVPVQRPFARTGADGMA
jgi:hypothetical protein